MNLRHLSKFTVFILCDVEFNCNSFNMLRQLDDSKSWSGAIKGLIVGCQRQNPKGTSGGRRAAVTSYLPTRAISGGTNWSKTV
jgi:hypothetical protein